MIIGNPVTLRAGGPAWAATDLLWPGIIADELTEIRDIGRSVSSITFYAFRSCATLESGAAHLWIAPR